NANFPATFFLGGAYRLDDAIIASVGMDFKNFRFGASYDINTSTLKEASSGNGGFELSLVYTGCILPVIPTHYVMPCPRY
ncbi:MAG TPA: type IX secretion system membrane protein PorP/SprF, partial [Chitinophagales bacterium]|nr:type IX secretion system membrane protein PorP/SprF [Chitinophagales bacterium]